MGNFGYLLFFLNALVYHFRHKKSGVLSYPAAITFVTVTKCQITRSPKSRLHVKLDGRGIHHFTVMDEYRALCAVNPY